MLSDPRTAPRGADRGAVVSCVCGVQVLQLQPGERLHARASLGELVNMKIKSVECTGCGKQYQIPVMTDP